MASDGADVTRDGRLFHAEVVAGNRMNPFAHGGEVERRYSKLVRGSRPESLPGWHVSYTGEV